MPDNTELRNRIIADHMGKIVRVVVDRPVGYRHGDIVYPVNYGYIPGVLAGDGEEQDAYILGITKPVTEFVGTVVAAIRRYDDCEDKLVAAPAGMLYHQGEIAQAVAFQEQFFRTTVDSMLRKSCGVIPFRYNAGEREYLVLLQTNGSWSFPKGHMEAGETEIQTAMRELMEETGLSAAITGEQRVTIEYDIPPYTRKQVVLFPGEVDGNVVLQKTEIMKHRWVKPEELGKYLHPDTFAACQRLLW